MGLRGRGHQAEPAASAAAPRAPARRSSARRCERQGVDPESMHLELGSGASRFTIRYTEVAARASGPCGTRWRRPARDRALPCPHCGVCGFRRHCGDRWTAEDHSRGRPGSAARTSRAARGRGRDAGGAGGDLQDGVRVPGIRAETLDGLRHQARVQVRSRDTGRLEWEPREVEAGRGWSAFPARATVTCSSTWRATPSGSPTRS